MPKSNEVRRRGWGTRRQRRWKPGGVERTPASVPHPLPHPADTRVGERCVGESTQGGVRGGRGCSLNQKIKRLTQKALRLASSSTLARFWLSPARRHQLTLVLVRCDLFPKAATLLDATIPPPSHRPSTDPPLHHRQQASGCCSRGGFRWCVDSEAAGTAGPTLFVSIPSRRQFERARQPAAGRREHSRAAAGSTD